MKKVRLCDSKGEFFLCAPLIGAKKAYIFSGRDNLISSSIIDPGYAELRELHEKPEYGDLHAVYVNPLCGDNDSEDEKNKYSILNRGYWFSKMYPESKVCIQEVFLGDEDLVHDELADYNWINDKDLPSEFMLVDGNRVYIENDCCSFIEYTPDDPEYAVYIKAAQVALEEIKRKKLSWRTDSNIKGIKPY